jgi:DNA repair protein RadC
MSGQLSLFALSPQGTDSYASTRPYAIPIYRVTLVRDAHVYAPTAGIHASSHAAEIIRHYLAGVDREHFVTLMLNRKHRVIGLNTVSIGTLTASLAHPREVFKPAILANAAALICAHNHPSGDPHPSAEDRAITTRLLKAGKLLDIPMLDHLVVGDGTSDYYSFADHGCMT